MWVGIAPEVLHRLESTPRNRPKALPYLASQTPSCVRLFSYGLHTLQGRWLALMASLRVLKLCRFAGEIFCAHLQPGL